MRRTEGRNYLVREGEMVEERTKVFVVASQRQILMRTYISTISAGAHNAVQRFQRGE